MVFVKFHNMKQKKKNSNVAFNLFFLLAQIFTTFQQVKTICPQFKFTNVQLFLLFFNLCTIFLKMFVFSFFFPYVQQCSSFFSLPFCLFPLSFFPYVQQCSSFFSLPFCLFPLSFTFFYFFLIINCSFLSFFSNLISTSLCLYLNKITIGSRLPVYSISNNISINKHGS